MGVHEGAILGGRSGGDWQHQRPVHVADIAGRQCLKEAHGRGKLELCAFRSRPACAASCARGAVAASERLRSWAGISAPVAVARIELRTSQAVARVRLSSHVSVPVAWLYGAYGALVSRSVGGTDETELLLRPQGGSKLRLTARSSCRGWVAPLRPSSGKLTPEPNAFNPEPLRNPRSAINLVRGNRHSNKTTLAQHIAHSVILAEPFIERGWSRSYLHSLGRSHLAQTLPLPRPVGPPPPGRRLSPDPAPTRGGHCSPRVRR